MSAERQLAENELSTPFDERCSGKEVGVSRRLLEAAAHVSGRDPERGLAAVRVLRREADRVEETQVAHALEAGWSWARIGRALGVSRQAVHRRYSRCPPVAEPAGGPVITNAVRMAFLFARSEAAARGDALAGTEHVLLGLLQAAEGRASEALRAAGADIRELRRLADDIAPHDLCDMPPSRIGLSGRTRKVLDRAARVAVRSGDGRVCDNHLLDAMLDDEESGAVHLLTAAGIEVSAVREALAEAEQGASGPAAVPA